MMQLMMSSQTFYSFFIHNIQQNPGQRSKPLLTVNMKPLQTDRIWHHLITCGTAPSPCPSLCLCLLLVPCLYRGVVLHGHVRAAARAHAGCSPLLVFAAGSRPHACHSHAAWWEKQEWRERGQSPQMRHQHAPITVNGTNENCSPKTRKRVCWTSCVFLTEFWV